MDKLYSQHHFDIKATHFIINKNINPPANIQRQGKDQQGRTVIYDYFAAAEKISKSPYKQIKRKIIGWFLCAISFGFFSRNSTVSAWMKGRRIDFIFISHHEKQITLNNVLTRGGLAQRIAQVHWEEMALEIMLFADKDQDVSAIIEKTIDKHENRPNMSRGMLKTDAAIEVIEQSLGIKFGENPQDDEKIIRKLTHRRICRSYHGTRKIAAKAIIEQGISFDRKDKKYDYEEFEKLFVECGLDRNHWPFALDKKKNDSCKFYVSYQAKNAMTYAQSNAPEWFLRFKEWGLNIQQELDVQQLRRLIKEKNPNITDVERVVKFVQNHWELCAAKKKTVAILIVEQNEKDLNLIHHTNFRGDLMDVYNSYKGSTYEKIRQIIENIPLRQGYNTGLDPEITKEPPKVIHAVKILN